MLIIMISNFVGSSSGKITPGAAVELSKIFAPSGVETLSL
jgi:hypothetical protein